MKALIEVLNKKHSGYPKVELYMIRGKRGLDQLAKKRGVPMGSLCYDLSSTAVWLKKRKWSKIPGT